MNAKLAMMATASSLVLAAPASAVPVYGLLSDNSLITFDSASPGTTTSPVTILGLGAGETVRGIDLRPRDSLLYGAVSLADGTGARIVTINPLTGATTAVAPLLNGNGGVLTPSANPVNFLGQRIGIDFNPQVDLLRVVSDQEQSLAINPGNRAAGGQAGTTRVDGTLNIGGQPTPDLNINGAAYTNNRDGATSTLLYTIDTVADLLYLQNPPNGGTQTNPQTLDVNAVGDSGFDIFQTGTAFASFQVDNPANLAAFYSINLANGDATFIGTIGGQSGLTRLTDITVATVPEPATLAMFGLGLVGLAGALRRPALRSVA
jgi:hypothetical protein